MEISLKNKEAISKAEITQAAIDLLDKLETGEISPMALIQKFKATEKIQEAIKTRLTELAVIEAQKYPESKTGVLIYGATFKVGEFGTAYDYSRCGDPVLVELTEAFDKAKKALEDRKEFLKGIKGHETIVNEDTSEIVTVYPPVKTSTTGVSCSIK